MFLSEYLGLLRPDEFPSRFEAGQPITAGQIRIGTRAWEAFTAADPTGLLLFAAAEHAGQSAAERAGQSAAEHAEHAGVPYLRAAIRRHLVEFPSTMDGGAVLSGRADHVALDGLDRWLGGTHLTSARHWRWTGTTLQMPNG